MSDFVKFLLSKLPVCAVIQIILEWFQDVVEDTETQYDNSALILLIEVLRFVFPNCDFDLD